MRVSRTGVAPPSTAKAHTLNPVPPMRRESPVRAPGRRGDRSLGGGASTVSEPEARSADHQPPSPLACRAPGDAPAVPEMRGVDHLFARLLGMRKAPFRMSTRTTDEARRDCAPRPPRRVEPRPGSCCAGRGALVSGTTSRTPAQLKRSGGGTLGLARRDEQPTPVRISAGSWSPGRRGSRGGRLAAGAFGSTGARPRIAASISGALRRAFSAWYPGTWGPWRRRRDGRAGPCGRARSPAAHRLVRARGRRRSTRGPARARLRGSPGRGASRPPSRARSARRGSGRRGRKVSRRRRRGRRRRSRGRGAVHRGHS